MSAPDLRLIVITDARVCAPRDIVDVVTEALDAGAPAIQLRDKSAVAVELFEAATALRELTRRAGALLFVNDRLDVALAAHADGVHLGPDDMPVAAARAVVPDAFLIGYSADTPAEALRAESDGASYIGCGAVFGTVNKAEARGEIIGLDRLAEVARSVAIPVVAIGGVSAENVSATARHGAAGAAVIGAVMGADDPGAEVRALLHGFERGRVR